MTKEKKGEDSLNFLTEKIMLFTSITNDTFKKLLGKKYEVSGKLKPTKNHFNIDKRSIQIGGKDEADIVEYLYTFHTHPKDAYILYNTELGFPSKGDFGVYLESFIKFNNLIHFVITLEGIYSITINPYFINKKLLKKNTDKYIRKNFSIDKQNFTRKKGILVNNFTIKTPKNFVNYANHRLFKDNKSLFIVSFKSWNTKEMVFKFFK